MSLWLFSWQYLTTETQRTQRLHREGKSSRKDYRKGDARSSSNRRSATSAELRPGRITAAAPAAKHLDRLERAPVERRRANRNPAASAEFRACWILVPATLACDSTKREWRRISRDRLERRVAAASAELYAFGKARLAFRTHNHRQRGRVCAMLTVETAATRRC